MADIAAAEPSSGRIELGPSDADAHTLFALFLFGRPGMRSRSRRSSYGCGLSPALTHSDQVAGGSTSTRADTCDGGAGEVRHRTVPDALQLHFVLGWPCGTRVNARKPWPRSRRASLSRAKRCHSASLGMCTPGSATKEARRLLREIEALSSDGPRLTDRVRDPLCRSRRSRSGLSLARNSVSDQERLVWLTPGFPGLDPPSPRPAFCGALQRVGAVS